ncbi:MAG: hypothetical protein HRU10_09145 [Opitutales bacterium]|nr:hypothetical protein [Opitutales bacterium]
MESSRDNLIPPSASSQSGEQVEMPVPYIFNLSTHGTVRWLNQTALSLLGMPLGALREKQVEDLGDVLPEVFFRSLISLLKEIAEQNSESGGDWLHDAVGDRMLLRWVRDGSDVEVHYFPATGSIRRLSVVERYVSPEILKLTEDDLERLKLPERRVLTVSFSDLRGFTELSEEMEPEESRNILNAYLTSALSEVWDHGGWIDKFIGDEVMSLYGAQKYSPNHAFNAVRGACSTIDSMERLQQDYESQGKKMLPLGIGINSGNMLIGNIGSDAYQEFTVIGAVVNLAARLSNVAAPGEVVLTEETLDAFLDGMPEDWECREGRITTHTEASLHKKRRRFVDELLPLAPDQEGKVISVGPGVLEDPNKAVYNFVYRFRVVVKGIVRPVPLIQARRLQPDPLKSVCFLAPQSDATADRVRLLGRYRLLELLTERENGGVWKARDGFGNTAALKTLEIPGDRGENWDREIREFAQPYSKLNHRNISRLFEVGEGDGMLYLASDYIDGPRLLSHIKEVQNAVALNPEEAEENDTNLFEQMRGSASTFKLSIMRQLGARSMLASGIPIETSINWLIQACDAVQFGYTYGFCHPAMQWTDFIVSDGGDLTMSVFRWVPFGQQRRLTVELALRNSVYEGDQERPFFLPPETSSPFAPLQAYSHVYSLGVLLRYLLTGVSVPEHLADQEKTDSEFRKSFFQATWADRDLDAIFRMATEDNPEQRYRSPSALADDLKAYLNDGDIRARKNSFGYSAVRLYRRNSRMVHSAALFCFIAITTWMLGEAFLSRVNEAWNDIPGLQIEEGRELVDFMYARSHRNLFEPMVLAGDEVILDASQNIISSIPVSGFVRVEGEFTYLGEPNNVEIVISGTPPEDGFPQGVIAQIGKSGGALNGISPLQFDRNRTGTAWLFPSKPRSMGDRVKFVFEHSEGALTLEVDGHEPIVVRQPVLELPAQGWIYLRNFSEKIRLHTFKVQSHQGPRFLSALKAIDQIWLSGSYEQAYERFLEMVRNDPDSVNQESALRRAASLHVVHAAGDVDMLIAEAESRGFSEIVEDLQEWLLEKEIKDYWYSGHYGLALNRLPELFDLNPKTRVVLELCVAMQRAATASETSRLMYWIGETQDVYALRILGPLTATSLEPLRGKKLHLISIEHAGISDLSPLVDMPLTTVSLSSNRIVDLSPLQGAPIKYFAARYNQIEDLTPLADAPLVELRVSLNQVGRFPRFSSQHLKTIWALGNPLQSIDPLAGLKLETLNIGRTQVGCVEVIDTMTSLEFLNIMNTEVKSVDWTHLKPSMTFFSASSTEIEDFSFLRLLPDLKRLSLSNSPFSDVSAIASDSLQSLDVSLTHVRSLNGLDMSHLHTLHTYGSKIEYYGELFESDIEDWWMASADYEYPELLQMRRRSELIDRHDWIAQIDSLAKWADGSIDRSIHLIPGHFQNSHIDVMAEHFGAEVLEIDSMEERSELAEMIEGYGGAWWVRGTYPWWRDAGLRKADLVSLSQYFEEKRFERFNYVFDDSSEVKSEFWIRGGIILKSPASVESIEPVASSD